MKIARADKQQIQIVHDFLRDLEQILTTGELEEGDKITEFEGDEQLSQWLHARFQLVYPVWERVIHNTFVYEENCSDPSLPHLDWPPHIKQFLESSEKAMDRDPQNIDCTRDPIYVLQSGWYTWTGTPHGTKFDDEGHLEVEDEDLLDDWIKPYVDDEGQIVESEEFWKDASGCDNLEGFSLVYTEWRIESVWLTRESAETFAECKKHRWPTYRVFCVPCEGQLARLLNQYEPTNLPNPDCPKCEGTGWYEGGETLKTDCECLRLCDKQIAEYAIERLDSWRRLYERLVSHGN